jgi:hypothetical protein
MRTVRNVMSVLFMVTVLLSTPLRADQCSEYFSGSGCSCYYPEPNVAEVSCNTFPSCDEGWPGGFEDFCDTVQSACYDFCGGAVEGGSCTNGFNCEGACYCQLG